MGARIPPTSPYNAIFNRETLRDQILDNSFPVTKRKAAQSTNGNSWLQKGSQCPYLTNGEDEEILTNINSLPAKTIEIIQTPKGIVSLNEPGIECALDRRVALFFQQCILCYKMPFVFSAKGAGDQIGSSRQLTFFSPEANKQVIQKREAAHSSTIPTLLATLKNEANAKTFVYLKGGSSYAQHNATIGMNIHVNGADELLDGKGEEGLRGAALKILNQVAEGLDPAKATKDFMKAFKQRAKASAQPLNDSDPRKAVLERYSEGMKAIAKNLKENPKFFDYLIGVKIEDNDPKDELLRKTIYKQRYDIITHAEVIENRIGKLIAEAKEKMNSREGTFLEFILLKEFTESTKSLEKLFGKTTAFFDEDYKRTLSAKNKSNLSSFETRIKNLQKKYPKLIEDLKRDLRREFRTLETSELAYRSKVFKKLRDIRGWTQQEFCDKHSQKTGEELSRAWVSRIEQQARIPSQCTYKTPLRQRTKILTLENAQNCAKTFGIDVGLFLPSLITSS